MDKVIITRIIGSENERHEQLIEANLDDRVYTFPRYGEGSTEYAVFYLPGLDQILWIPVNREKYSWTFDGNKKAPTFSPSLLTTCKRGEKQLEFRNHVFIRNGMIEYLADCTHNLAGKTIELPKLRDWPKEFQNWKTAEN